MLTQTPLPRIQTPVDGCEPDIMVCGVTGLGHVEEFRDRCAAEQAGAKRILEGPCFDAN